MRQFLHFTHLCLYTKRLSRYAWKAAAFSVLIPFCAATELGDFSPFWATFDAHSIWHALTAPCAWLFWSFLHDDAQHETAKRLVA